MNDHTEKVSPQQPNPLFEQVQKAVLFCVLVAIS
jgi:hypothetical protein